MINALVPKPKPKCFVCNIDLTPKFDRSSKCCGFFYLVNFDGTILEVSKEFLIISKKQDKYEYVFYTPDPKFNFHLEEKLLEEWYDDLTIENYEKFIKRAEKLKVLL